MGRRGPDGGAIAVLRTTPLVIKSAEDQTYEILRDEIVHAMEPGLPLPLAQIAERLGVSTMPVRAGIDGLAARRGAGRIDEGGLGRMEVAFHDRFVAAAAAHDGPAAEAIFREELAWTLERLTRRLAPGTLPPDLAHA